MWGQPPRLSGRTKSDCAYSNYELGSNDELDAPPLALFFAAEVGLLFLCLDLYQGIPALLVSAIFETASGSAAAHSSLLGAQVTMTTLGRIQRLGFAA